MAVDFSSIVIGLPECVASCNLPDHVTKYCVIYISAKWFNYFSIFMGVAFDWAYVWT